ncbi:MAG: response regulator [Spirochaetaceae bacterium]|jgi:putative two-component system response regulator|nr:response regulator [Spirochaetaceae bacterium]
MQKPVLVVVDDNAVNLTFVKNILKEKYEVFTTDSAVSFFELLPHISPDLILLDVAMPGMNGYEILSQIKEDDAIGSIPVIFITAKDDLNSELEGLKLGAIDYITKPFSPPLFLKRIENHLTMYQAVKALKEHNIDLREAVDEKNTEISELQNAILRIVAELVEFREDANNGRIKRTQKYLKIFVDMMIEKGVYYDEVSQWNLEYFIPAAQLYDVGKIAISDILLNKPAKFSHEEFELMKKHTIFGVAAIKEIEQQTKSNQFLQYAKIFAGSHHEKWDGTGYPQGLKESEIPLPGRVMSIIDVYDGLISARPYRRAISRIVAERVIIGSAGTSFDPVLIELFKHVKQMFCDISYQTDNRYVS